MENPDGDGNPFMNDPFFSKNVCTALLNSELITVEQGRKIFQRKFALRKRLAALQQKQMREESAEGIYSPIVVVDLLPSPMNINHIIIANLLYGIFPSLTQE